MATKSEPFSISLSKTTDELITREARRTRRSKGAVVEALAEEALLPEPQIRLALAYYEEARRRAAAGPPAPQGRSGTPPAR